MKIEHFEYNVIRHKFNDSVESELNTLGEKGWELVCALPYTIDGNTDYIKYFFKRKVVKITDTGPR
jgi:hypothetical protein